MMSLNEQGGQLFRSLVLTAIALLSREQ